MIKEVLALAGKDVRLLMRDKGGAFVTFVFPLIYCVFFGLVFAVGGTSRTELSIVVVDEDRTDLSRSLIQRLDEAEGFAVERADRQRAIELVRRGKRVAYVALTKGFGESIASGRGNPKPTIEIGVDPARPLEAGMNRGHLIQQVIVSMDGVTRHGEGSSRSIDFHMPVEIVTSDVTTLRTRPHNEYDISFPQGIIWGVLGCCASFVISMVVERTGGTLSRLKTAPISRTTILAGKAVACFGSTVVLAIVLFVVGRIFFGVVPRNLAHLAVSVVFIAIAFVGIMMFLSLLGKTERAVGGVAWGALLGMAMVGGGMVPRMFMPHWMQTLSHISPVRWAILAMEGAVWRDLSTVEMLTPWGILLGVGVLFFALGTKGLAWADQRS